MALIWQLYRLLLGRGYFQQNQMAHKIKYEKKGMKKQLKFI